MQISILEDLKAQLSDSLEVQQQLQTRATSLEETQALVAEELRVHRIERDQSVSRQATLEAAIAEVVGKAGPSLTASPSRPLPLGLVRQLNPRI